jgi:DNA-binding beta-propeller fold protein YncE
MSSDFQDLIQSDLERIPLPPEDRWTMPRARRGRVVSAAVVAIVVALVVVGSLGAGQALRAIRDRIDSDRAAVGALVPGDDYLTDGAPTPLGSSSPMQAIDIVAMPAGQLVGRFVGDTYVGTAYEGGLMSISGDRAFLPVARSTGVPSEDYETYLQEIDLRRGIPLRRIATGIVPVPHAFQAEVPGTPIFPAATATSSDGSSVWLVRDTGEHGLVTLVDRFDGQTLAPLAHLVLSSSGPGAVRSRVVALGPDRLAVVRDHFDSLNRVAADWYFLDAQLRVIASYADDSEHRLPAGGQCSVQANPASAGWLVLCSDSSLFSDGALLFLDPGTLAVNAAVTLPRERGFALGMTFTTDGTIYVLSDRPVVTRIDARRQQMIDARPVTEARSWIDQLLPPVVAAKNPGGPSVAFSPDGRYAYVASPSEAWWGSLATIDMRDAKVVAHTTAFGAVAAVGLSPGGERLYALAIDSQGVRRVVLLAPATLRLAGQSVPLANDPFAIIAVRRQTPSGP